MMHALLDLMLIYILACLGRNAHGSEIINGQKVPKNLMLYMASVQTNRNHVCGGFLISEDFVVTAAHCDKNSKMEVVLGTHNLKKVNDSTMRYKAKKCKHPDFKKVEYGDDIMLLKLSRKVRLDNKVQVVQLPKSELNVKENTKCRVAGWGFTKTRGKAVDVLNVVKVPVLKFDVCKNQWKHRPTSVDLPSNVICAGGSNSDAGFCGGDSGGPLVCGGTAVGVVSFNMNGNCDYPNRPNVYTDISKYLPWIKRILKEKRC